MDSIVGAINFKFEGRPRSVLEASGYASTVDCRRPVHDECWWSRASTEALELSLPPATICQRLAAVLSVVPGSEVLMGRCLLQKKAVQAMEDVRRKAKDPRLRLRLHHLVVHL
jgi:hypothetical protein